MFADVGGVPAIMSKSDDGHANMWGMSGMWIFALVIIFFALAFFGGNFGGNKQNTSSGLAEIAALNAAGGLGNNNAANTAFTELNGRLDGLAAQISHINDVNDLRDLKSTQAQLNQNVTQQAFNLSTQLATNRTDTLLNFKDLALQASQSTCDVRRDIDGVRFDNAQNTCAIINAVNAGTQRVIDNQTASEITRLRDELARERLAASQTRQDLFIERQSDRVIGALTPPCPVPSYPAWPSNQPINPVAYSGIPGANYCV